jgi:hypothetical protein
MPGEINWPMMVLSLPAEVERLRAASHGGEKGSEP